MSDLVCFDSPPSRAGTCCIKWDRASGKFQQDGVLPLWIADTDFACPPAVLKALNTRCAHPILGYSFAPETFYTGIQQWFETRHGLTVPRSWIHPACGVVTSVSYAVQALTKPGDQVLIQTPVYDPFAAVVTGTGRTLVESPLVCREGHYEMDFEGLETAFAGGVAMMILCNPHNPVGRVWTRAELARLAALCVQYHVYVVSDEIHCDFVFPGHPFTSILAFPELYPLAVACIAPGKSFNLSGLSVSANLIPDPEVDRRLTEALRSAWLINPNALGLEAAAAAYTDGGPWMDAQLAYLAGNIRLVQDRLAAEAPHIIPAPHEGTFLMWLNFRAFGLDNEALSRELVHTWGLGMNEGWHYGTGGDGYMRLNVGCTRALLNEALDRLAAMDRAHFPTTEERS